jgi:hypothetical protein
MASATDATERSGTSAEERLLHVGVVVAVVGAVVQTAVHSINHLLSGPAFLSVNEEHNPITWVHSSLILLAGFGVALLALVDARRRRSALAAAAILVFLSLDEAVSIHENLARATLDLAGLSRTWDSVVWPILFVPLAAALVALLWALLRTAPRRIRRYVTVALLWLGAAVLVEIVAAPVSTGRNAAHAIAGAGEEAAEFIGWSMLAAGLIANALLGWGSQSSRGDGTTRSEPR